MWMQWGCVLHQHTKWFADKKVSLLPPSGSISTLYDVKFINEVYN